MSHVPIRISPEPGRNLRQCPALQGYIKPADCGAYRGSQIQCPDDCVHFPLGTANPEARAKVLESTLDKATVFLMEDLGNDPFRELCWGNRYDDPDQDAEDQDEADDEALESGLDHTVLQCVTGRVAGRASDALARWTAQGLRTLNNDERQMLRQMATARVALLEVQRTTSAGDLLCLDPMDAAAAPVTLRDPRMAATTPRFSRLLTWIVPTAERAMSAGIGVFIRHEVWPGWRAEMTRRFAAGSAAQPGLSWTEHLTRSLPEAVRLEVQLYREWAERSRAELRQGHWFAEWAIVDSAAELAEEMRTLEDFAELDPDDVPGAEEPMVAAFEWFAVEADDEDAEADEHIETLGEVHVLQRSVIVETESQDRHELGLEFMLEVFGDRLRLLEERQGEPTVDCGVLPGPDAQDDERAFLDAPHPELDQSTPRAAAQDPALRPRLVELVKRHLHALDTDRLAGKPVADYGWLLEELGMTDLR